MDARAGNIAPPSIGASILFTLELAAISFVAIWLLYVAAANAVLRYGIGPIVDDPDIAIAYSSAHSLWFGDVELEGLAIAQEAGPVQWSLAAKQAHARLEVGELFGHTLHVTHFEASGFAYRLRIRETRSDAERRAAKALPPIAPFSDPPLWRYGAPEPRAFSTWKVQVDDSDVAVEELWIHHTRFVGHARSRGAFAVWPQHLVRVGPALLEVSDGDVSLGPHHLAHAVSGRIDFTLDPLDPTKVDEFDTFRFISSHAVVDGEIDGLATLELFFDGLRIDDGSGAAHVDARIQHGIVEAGSVASFRSRFGAFSRHPIGIVAIGDLAIDAHVEPHDGENRIVIEGDLPPASLLRADVEAKAGRIDRAKFSFAIDGADLTGDDAFGGASLDIPRARLPDARLADPLRDDVPRPLSGEATASLHAKIDENWRGKAIVDATTAKARVRYEDVIVTADSTSHLEIGELDLAARTAKFSGDGDAVNWTITRGNKTTPALWTRLKLPAGEVSFARELPELSLHFQGHLNDAAPLVEIFGAGEPASFATRLLGAHASDYDLVLGEKERVLTLRAGATAGSLKVRGAVRYAGETRRGAFLIDDGPMSIGVDVTKGNGGVAALASSAWLTARLAELAAPAH